MKTLENKPMYFMGDNHGQYDYMMSVIKNNNIENCYLIHLGDGGEGFLETNKQCRQFVYLNEFFQANNIHYMSIRGNHSDPFYFKNNTRINLSNFELIEDYTVLEYNKKLIQFIGGATSIDRVIRTVNVSYWVDEPLVFNPELCQKVDVLVTHTTPPWCYPQQFNKMVYEWATKDESLIKDLTNERILMKKIFEICQPSLHLYGHFHDSWTETINECVHKLLNINEIWEFRQ